jgi:hypothetical protein
MKIAYMGYSHNGLFNQFASFQMLGAISQFYKDYKIDAVWEQLNERKIENPQADRQIDISKFEDKLKFDENNPDLRDLMDYDYPNVEFHGNDLFLRDRLNSNIVNIQQSYVNCTDQRENEDLFSMGRSLVKLDENKNNILTVNLMWYSKFFFNRTKDIDQRLSSVRFKKEYYDLAKKIKNYIGDFNGAHVRTMIDHYKYFRFTPENLNQGLNSFNDNSLPIYISVDDFNNPLLDTIEKDVKFVHEIILNEFYEDFKNLTYHDNNVLGLISALVMSMANDFVGSLRSTYTIFIHQERCVNDLPSFKYFGNPFPTYDVNHLPYSWNSVNNEWGLTWDRDWKECKLNV